MAEHGFNVDCSDTDERFICYVSFRKDRYVAAHLHDHPSKKATIRYAIITAAIAKLDSLSPDLESAAPTVCKIVEETGAQDQA